MAIYSTVRTPGATLVPSAVLPSSAFAAGPALLLLPPSSLIQLLPSLKALATSPIVIQVSTAASSDHAPVLALRSAGLVLVYSSTESHAAANAIVAASIAASGRGVIHFGEFSANKVDFGLPTAPAAPQASSSAFADAYAAAPAAAPFVTSGDASPSTVILALGNTAALAAALPPSTSLVSLSLYRPLAPAALRALVPQSAKTVVVLEQTYSKSGKWSPVFLDVVGAFAESDEDAPVILSGTLGTVTDGAAAAAQISGMYTRLTEERVSER